MDYSKLTKEELINELELLKKSVSQTKNEFGDKLFDLFENDKLIEQYGNDLLNYVAVHDFKGNYIAINPYLSAILKKELNTSSIKNIRDIIDKSYHEKLDEYFKKLKTDKKIKGVFKTKNSTDEDLFLSFNSTVYKDKNNNDLVISTGNFITEIFKTKLELSAKQKELELITENSPSNIIKIDKNHVILFNNLLKTPEQKKLVLGKKIYDFILPEYHKHVKEKLKESFTKKTKVVYELEGITPSTKERSWYISYVSPILEEDKVTGAIISTFNNNETKKLQEETIASEEKYRKLIELNPDAIIIHQNGKIKYCNPAAIKLVKGKKESDLLDKSILDFVHSDYIKPIQERIQKIVKTGKSSPLAEEVLFDLNGNELYVEVQGTLVEYEKKPAIQVIIKNIAEKKEFNIIQTRYRKILDTMNEGVIIVDRNEKIQYVNKRFCEILGYKESELIGKISYDTIVPPSEHEKINNISFDRAKGIKSQFEIKLLHKKGHTVWVHNSGTPYVTEGFSGSIGVISDITETKELRDNQTETLKNINEIIYRLKVDKDPINTEVVYVSNKIKDVVGFSAAEFIKKPEIWINNIHPDDIEPLKKITKKLYKEKGSGIREYRFKNKKTGKYIWLEDKISFKADQNGKVVEQFGASRDITNQKNAILELQKAHAKFKNLFDSSKDAVLILKNGEAIDCNLGSLEMFEENKSNLLGLGYLNFISKKFKNQKIAQKIKNAESGIPQKFEWSIINPSKNESKICEVIINRLFLEDGSHLQIIIRDISDQIKAKIATETSEKSFKGLFNNSSDMMFIIGKDGFFMDVNNEVLNTLGYKKSELKKMTTKDLSADGQDKDYSSKAWKGYKQKFEWISLSKAGEEIPIEINLKKSEYFGEEVLIANARDISTRKKNELALKSSEEKFRRLFSTANDAIFIMDNETFVDCNEQTLIMFACKRNEIIGHPPYEFSPEFQPDGRSSFEKAMEKITNAIKGTPQRFYWQHVTKKGVPFDAEVSLNHFQLDGKIYIQAIVRDISEKMKADRALKQSEAKFKTIADNAPVLIRMTDTENKTYFFSNQFSDFLGSKSEKNQHSYWIKAIHKDEKDLVLDTHNQAFSNKIKFEISYRIKNKSGKYRWVLETGIPHYNEINEFVGYITASIDITERKTVEEALKNEEALRKSSELFKDTLKTISLVAVSLDNYGNITFCNDHFCHVLCSTQENLIGKNWFDLFVPKKEKKARKQEYLKRVKSGNMPNNFTSSIISLNGDHLILSWHNIFIRDERGNVIGVTSIGEDITQNKHDELVKEIYNNINKFSIEVSSLKEFYEKSHEELNKLFNVKNFYISLYIKELNRVSFPYFIDENHPGKTEIPSRNYKDSLSEFVINSNQTQVLNKEDFTNIYKKKKLKIKGKIAEQWIGIPLKTKENAFGILVVQDYHNEHAFSDSDIKILAFISNQISLAIEKIHNKELIQKSEAKFRNIFENLQDLYYRTDLEGNFTLMSPSVRKFTGMNPEFFIGKNIKNFYSNPNDRDSMISELLDKGFINNFETIMLKPTGEKVSVQANIKLTLDDNGNPAGIEGMVRDVTEMLEAQNLIKESEAKFRNIFESFQDVYYKSRMDGTIEVISPSVYDIIGYKPEELIGKNISKFYANKNDITEFNQLIKEKKTLKNYETKLTKKDESTINALANAQILYDEKENPIAIEGIIRDISNIKQTEEDLKLFENIIQNNWDAIVFCDLSGVIKYINEAANKLYGYENKELIGENVDTFNTNLTHNTDEIITQIQEKGGWVGELKQKKKDGEIFDAMLSVQLIFNKKGEPIGMASHSKDISDRIKEEKELIEAKNLAESSLKVKEQFLANMSHELRTPMNGIIGIAELLKDTPLQEEQNEFVNIIQKSSSNLLNILNDILDLSKIEAGKIEIIPSPTSIDNLLRKLISLFEYQVKNKKIDLNYQLDKNIPQTLLIDETRLIQILSNLISNAIKFTNKGGINIEVKNIKLEKGKVKLLFKVIDTGVGIKKEEFGKLFNYFSQLDNTFKKQHKGTGLGLAISKELVVLMGGEIGIQSKEEKGSTFWFTIQAEIDHNEEEIIQNVEVSNTSIANSKILIVDDNKTNLLVAQKLMEKHSNNVFVANSGFECLNLLKTTKYDLIFMDIQMPEMDGIETLKEIKKLNLDTPVIAMTAYAMKDDKNKFIKHGFNDYLPKPINGDSIVKILQKWGNTVITTTPNVNNTDKKTNQALEQLRAIGGDDFVQEVLEDFNEETNKIISELKIFITNNDIENCRSHFHTLKGSSGTIGLNDISDICKQGEIYSKEERIEKIKDSIEEIDKLFNTFRLDFIQSSRSK